jgi:hypothetical protein
MQDYVLCMSLIELYQSSKNKEWRKQVKERQTAIFKFLEANGLNRVPLLDSSGNVPEEFELKCSHLVEDGVKLFAKAVPAWERARDKDGNISNIKQLEDGLKKIRSEK